MGKAQAWRRRGSWVLTGAVALFGWVGGVGCTTTPAPSGGGNNNVVVAMGGQCMAGQTRPCTCVGGTVFQLQCLPDGTFDMMCPCPAAAAGTTGSAGSVAPAPIPSTSGAAGTIGGAAGTSAAGVGVAGAGGVGGTDGSAGMAAAGTAAAGGGGSSGNPSDDMDALRQTCVDYINMYRATLSVAALNRATPSQEMCSDTGAQQDGDSGQAHGSAGMCQGLGGQDTCPGWGVGGFSGNATLADALTNCLDQMWAEGPPPVPEAQCIQDYQNCFLKHGHYMNMSNAMYHVVSCGFYEMSDGSWWMNQDFGF